jgi:hypothetical protein
MRVSTAGAISLTRPVATFEIARTDAATPYRVLDHVLGAVQHDQHEQFADARVFPALDYQEAELRGRERHEPQSR